MLFRAHPQRHLKPFEVRNGNQKLVVQATAIYPKNRDIQRYPLEVAIFGGHQHLFGEEVARFSLDPSVLPSEQYAVSQELIIPLDQVQANADVPALYAIRGYTEASMHPEASFRLRAAVCPPNWPTWYSLCLDNDEFSVDVNLLTADLGYGYQLPNMVGEVAHSLDPWIGGGEQGLFYGMVGPDSPILAAAEGRPKTEGNPRIRRLPDRRGLPLLRDQSLFGKIRREGLSRIQTGERRAFSINIPAGCQDNDGDGILSPASVNQEPEACGRPVDICPQDAEDFDGIDDDDGCPDLAYVPPFCEDLDGDGIYHSDEMPGACGFQPDACPTEPEDFDGFDDDDGCTEAAGNDIDLDGRIDSEDATPLWNDDTPPLANYDCGDKSIDRCIDDADNQFVGFAPLNPIPIMQKLAASASQELTAPDRSVHHLASQKDVFVQVRSIQHMHLA